MQKVLTTIWTRVFDYISFDGNHYSKPTSVIKNTMDIYKMCNFLYFAQDLYFWLENFNGVEFCHKYKTH